MWRRTSPSFGLGRVSVGEIPVRHSDQMQQKRHGVTGVEECREDRCSLGVAARRGSSLIRLTMIKFRHDVTRCQASDSDRLQSVLNRLNHRHRTVNSCHAQHKHRHACAQHQEVGRVRSCCSAVKPHSFDRAANVISSFTGLAPGRPKKGRAERRARQACGHWPRTYTIRNASPMSIDS